jgi:hypothetical protein
MKDLQRDLVDMIERLTAVNADSEVKTLKRILSSVDGYKRLSTQTSNVIYDILSLYLDKL